MSDVVISAEGLGKKYLIGHQSAERERYTALRDVIGRSLKGLGQSALDMVRGRQIVAGDEVEEFWALKDVSFEIKRGEVVGIIGRNGAGKSTLLKILSRITEPSAGRVSIKGRVASLLEVGTGFHPELTGRENIYLNGAILGMTRAEIKKKFDEIVAFAEVERFLDTPVKRYSSGMYVRLAFAVAAHLEPEILVVDEVLAVGDAEFQKKCLGKMQDVAGHGRTVLFVSHNMGAVESLCSAGLLLKAGKLSIFGETAHAIAAYSQPINGESIADLTQRRRSGSFRPIMKAVQIVGSSGRGGPIRGDDDLCLRVAVAGVPEINRPNLGFTISHHRKGVIAGLNCKMSGIALYRAKSGQSLWYECTIRKPQLLPGIYSISLWFGNDSGVDLDAIEDAAIFEIMQSDVYRSGTMPNPNLGVMYLDGSWRTVEGELPSCSNGAAPNAAWLP